MDVIFHGFTDQRITLIDVSYVPGSGFNLYSLHGVQKTQVIVTDASGTHVIGTNLAFLRSSNASYLRATRFPAGTVGARKKLRNMHVTNLFRAVATPRSASATRTPLPPPPQLVCDWHVWWHGCKRYGDLYNTGTDPISLPQFCVGEN